MLLPVLAMLLQTAGALPAGQPVRLTLEPATVAPAEPVHVFVEVAGPGHLLVLRIASDGRAEVVFPLDPSEGTFVAAGSYEIRPAGRSAAFIAAEPAGSGVVLAALAGVQYEFDEFVRGGAWDPVALASGGAGVDAAGRLLDIVQRMLGPEYFHYDVALYTVAPYPARTSDVIGAAYVGFAPPADGWFVGWVPAHPCGVWWWGCSIDVAFCGRFARRGGRAASCHAGSDDIDRPPSRVIARYRRGELLGASAASPAPAAPSPSRPPTPIGPRRREPGAGVSAAPAGSPRPVSLSSGRRVAPASVVAGRGAGPRRTPQAGPTVAPVPERVPWPGTVIARGQKTRTPVVRPREARLKQSTFRPPVPERVPWPTGATPRQAKPAAPAPAALAPAAPRKATAVSVGRAVGPTAVARSGTGGTVRSVVPATPARAPSSATASSRSSGGARAYVPARAAPSSGGTRAGGGSSGKH